MWCTRLLISTDSKYTRGGVGCGGSAGVLLPGASELYCLASLNSARGLPDSVICLRAHTRNAASVMEPHRRYLAATPLWTKWRRGLIMIPHIGCRAQFNHRSICLELLNALLIPWDCEVMLLCSGFFFTVVHFALRWLAGGEHDFDLTKPTCGTMSNVFWQP